MKSVTTQFQEVQRREGTQPSTRVYIKRRYWDGISAYVYESDWTEISRTELILIDPIIHSFDTQTFNEFKVSNTILRFRNDRMQWKEGSHTDSKFKPDGIATFGYEPYLTKFQIRSGFQNVGQSDLRVGETLRTSGNDELVTIFTGFATEYWTDSDSRVAFLRCVGLEELLLNGDASAVSTTATLETLGTGDGVSFNFYTKHNGVAKITEITVNSVALNPGTDYEVLGLGGFDNPAQIELANPPASTYLVKCSYTYWKRNQTVESLITDLVTEAGITLTDIDTATLGVIQNNITLSSQSEFEEGTNTSIDTSSEPGSLQIDIGDSANLNLFQNFGSGNLASNGWSGVGASATQSFDIVSGELKVVNGTGGELDFDLIRKSYAQDFAFGGWQMDVRVESNGGEIWWGFIANTDTELDHHWYYLKIKPGFLGGDLILLVQEEGSDPITLSTANTGIDFTSTKTVKVTRSVDGIFRVYVGGVLYIVIQDQTIDSGDRMIIYSQNVTGTSEIFIDNIYVPQVTLTATHVSKSFDTQSGLSAWGNITVDRIITVGSLTIQTRSSTDNSSWDAYISPDANGVIQSAVKRYLQVKITFSLTSGFSQGAFFAPGLFSSSQESSGDKILKVLSYTVQFTSDRVFVAMGNFDGMTCYQAIQELAKLVDFEWGLNDSETFFFRERDVSATPDETFTQNQNLLKILSLVNGYDQVYSIFRAQFGNFVAEHSADAGVRTSPLEIYGKKFFQISSSILLNEDTNLADALADIYKTRLEVKKQRARILAKYWPQIELSDTLSITFKHEPLPPPNVHDPETPLAIPEPYLDALIGKVVYVQHDPFNLLTEIEVEEIV